MLWLTLTGKPRRDRCTKRLIRFWPGTQAQYSDAADAWFQCALAERDPAAAERALVALGDNPCWGDGPVFLGRSFGEGLLARMMKDEARAHAAFTQGSSGTGKDRASASRLWTTALRARSDRRRAGAKRRGVAGRAARDRTFSRRKRFNPMAVRCLSISL